MKTRQKKVTWKHTLKYTLEEKHKEGNIGKCRSLTTIAEKIPKLGAGDSHKKARK